MLQKSLNYFQSYSSLFLFYFLSQSAYFCLTIDPRNSPLFFAFLSPPASVAAFLIFTSKIFLSLSRNLAVFLCLRCLQLSSYSGGLSAFPVPFCGAFCLSGSAVVQLVTVHNPKVGACTQVQDYSNCTEVQLYIFALRMRKRVDFSLEWNI